MKHLANLTLPFHEMGSAIRQVLRDSLKDEPFRFSLVIAASVVVALLPFVVQGANGLLLNHLARIIGSGTIDAWLIALVALLIAAMYLQDAMANVSNFMIETLRLDNLSKYETRLSDKLTKLDPATHEDPHFKDRLQVLQEYGNGHAIVRFYTSLIGLGIAVVSFGTAFVVVTIVDWRLALLILVLSMPRLYIEFRHSQGMWKLVADQSPHRRMYFEFRRHTQSADGIREIQAFQTAPYFVRRLKESLERYFKAEKHEDRKRFVLQFVTEALLTVGIAVALVVLVMRVIDGTMQLGTFTFVMGTILGLEGAATRLLLTVAEQRGNARPVVSYYEIMALEPRIQSPVHGVKIRTDRAPRIEFRNVSFAYPGAPDRLVLKDFNLSIESGERMALVGINGAGKSTLTRLLCRHYDPTEGTILLDGTDLRDVDLERWYSSLAILGQDFQTYRLRIGELIQLGRLGTGEQTCVERAAFRSGAASFIEGFETRYEQQIGIEFAGGIDLSGGQRQKLALSRALYRDALVTVLDEPTAHVDAGAEQEIFDRLEAELRPDQSLILISHRFSTVRNADRICVIGDGTVLELGSHAELVRQDGVYADLFRKQAKGYQ